MEDVFYNAFASSQQYGVLSACESLWLVGCRRCTWACWIRKESHNFGKVSRQLVIYILWNDARKFIPLGVHFFCITCTTFYPTLMFGAWSTELQLPAHRSLTDFATNPTIRQMTTSFPSPSKLSTKHIRKGNSLVCTCAPKLSNAVTYLGNAECFPVSIDLRD